MVMAAQITTFSDTTLETYTSERSRRPYLQQSLPIYNSDTEPSRNSITGFPILILEKGNLRKQSYIRLKHFYKVPSSKLRTYSFRRCPAHKFRIAERSYSTLMSEFGLKLEAYDSTSSISQTANSRLAALASQNRRVQTMDIPLLVPVQAPIPYRSQQIPRPLRQVDTTFQSNVDHIPQSSRYAPLNYGSTRALERLPLPIPHRSDHDEDDGSARLSNIYILGVLALGAYVWWRWTRPYKQHLKDLARSTAEVLSLKQVIALTEMDKSPRDPYTPVKEPRGSSLTKSSICWVIITTEEIIICNVGAYFAVPLGALEVYFFGGDGQTRPPKSSFESLADLLAVPGNAYDHFGFPEPRDDIRFKRYGKVSLPIRSRTDAATLVNLSIPQTSPIQLSSTAKSTEGFNGKPLPSSPIHIENIKISKCNNTPTTQRASKARAIRIAPRIFTRTPRQQAPDRMTNRYSTTPSHRSSPVSDITSPIPLPQKSNATQHLNCGDPLFPWERPEALPNTKVALQHTSVYTYSKLPTPATYITRAWSPKIASHPSGPSFAVRVS
ncbi:hypothetical protein B7494_g5181 [Chlorociboria aeruginascens]|nr:hypothetical protein B7494_g5181 [Chlorociboria aeruginascens]